MNQSSVKKGLTVKDLVTVGIFSALFLVFALVGGIFFAPNPVLTFYMPVGSALLCGPVYLLMMAKVKKRLAATILGAVLWIIWFVGNGTRISHYGHYCRPRRRCGTVSKQEDQLAFLHSAFPRQYRLLPRVLRQP